MTDLKVITGGQTGIDRMSLEIAKEVGVPTGGTAARGWITENGPDLSLKDFGLVEAKVEGYPFRTKVNVIDSDGTIIFGDASSNGSILAINTCIKQGKPYICNPSVNQFIEFIDNNKIHVVNIAGNRGSKLSQHLIEPISFVISRSLTILKNQPNISTT